MSTPNQPQTHEAVLSYLEDAGVQYYAGMVGSTSAPYVVGIGASDTSRYIGVRHEQVAAAIVDGVGRLTRRPGCLVTHGSSGLLAASLGVASAARDNIPMLVLSTTQERQAVERKYWQTSNVLAPLSAVAKYQARVERPDRARRGPDGAPGQRHRSARRRPGRRAHRRLHLALRR